jgi:hypothetical protein
MPAQPLREVNAKVEGRDQPEGAKETMGAFRALTKRLLGVSPAEVAKQERLYEQARETRHDNGIALPTIKSRKSKMDIPSPLNQGGELASDSAE